MIVSIKCPKCRALIGANPSATSLAICMCGHRIDLTSGSLEPQHRRDFSAIQEERLGKLRLLWRELHSYSFSDEWDRGNHQAWFNDWLSRVPSFGCDCQSHFKAITKDIPPDFTSRDSFFAWSWKVHDIVSERLGNVRYTLGEARLLY